MVRSMTGFGRCEESQDNRKIIIEMKSVNHKFFDLNIKTPKKLNFFESAIRNYLKKHISRGKVDLFISYEDTNENKASIKYNSEMAKEYIQVFKKMEEELNIVNDVKVTSFLRCSEVLSIEEQSIDEEELWKLIEKALSGAVGKFVESRAVEGESLKSNLLEKLDNMLGHVSFIEERSPMIISEYRNKIEGKVKDLLTNHQIDENRILAEVVLFSDKICIDEEIVRLRSHVEHMKSTLTSPDAVGRKLDFITQEMNREANTILSKANDLIISNKGIEIKTEIEKIREQIQNIE